MMQNNFICQHCSAFTASSGLKLLFKHNTIPCTTDHLPTILVVLEDGPKMVSTSLLNLLVLDDDKYSSHSML